MQPTGNTAFEASERHGSKIDIQRKRDSCFYWKKEIQGNLITISVLFHLPFFFFLSILKLND